MKYLVQSENYTVARLEGIRVEAYVAECAYKFEREGRPDTATYDVFGTCSNCDRIFHPISGLMALAFKDETDVVNPDNPDIENKFQFLPSIHQDRCVDKSVMDADGWFSIPELSSATDVLGEG